MDIYSIFKFLHVICAVAWVGGGLTLLAAHAFAVRANGDADFFSTLNIMNSLGKVWFVPASMLTLVFGILTTAVGGMWFSLWVLLGLAGFASTFLTGILLIEPGGRKIAEAVAAGRAEEALVTGKRLIQIAKFDYVVMLLVIADMVLKPHWTDIGTLAAFAAVLAAGAWFFLLGRKLPSPATA